MVIGRLRESMARNRCLILTPDHSRVSRVHCSQGPPDAGEADNCTVHSTQLRKSLEEVGSAFGDLPAPQLYRYYTFWLAQRDVLFASFLHNFTSARILASTSTFKIPHCTLASNRSLAEHWNLGLPIPCILAQILEATFTLVTEQKDTLWSIYIA